MSFEPPFCATLALDVRSHLTRRVRAEEVNDMARERGHHQHEALKHRHKHYHVTHYLHKGENWGHLLSTHAHEHNHPALEHVHMPHRDVDKEHRREAHVHDHARPAESPS
jgi:hypothetical protein